MPLASLYKEEGHLGVVIGLTGSIATGKSTVANKFKELGIPVIDADKIAREVVEPQEEAYKGIVETFGKEILLEDQTIDRKKLGDIVFKDATKREQLNNIVHPAIRKRMLEQRDAYLNDGNRCVVMDIPLLFESKLEHFVDKILVVYVDEDVQLQRLMKRNDLTKEEALQRIHSQMPIKKKAELADRTIDNNGTKAETYAQLKEILKEWNVLR